MLAILTRSVYILRLYAAYAGELALSYASYIRFRWSDNPVTKQLRGWLWDDLMDISAHPASGAIVEKAGGTMPVPTI
jgi:hypothetical protein